MDRTVRTRVVWLALAAAIGPGPDRPADAAKDPIQMTTLWQIGSADGAGSEFALSVDDFHLYASRFPAGPLFVVGRSSPARDWAHVQPGPLDTWAGAREHTFTVRFGLDAVDATGPSRLVIDLADAHRSFPPKLRIGLNDFVHECATAAGTSDTLETRPPDGVPQRIAVDLPDSALRTGDNTLTITTLTGCWLIYDRVALETSAAAEPASVRTVTSILTGWTRPVVFERPEGQRQQQLRLLIEHAGDPCEAVATVTEADEDLSSTFELRPGRQHVDVPVPGVQSPTPATIEIRIGEETVAERRLEIRPVRPWVVYLVHHTHLDIGYTHVQSEVEALQWRHLERAVELAAATAEYPEEARLRWNPEGLWAVHSYLRQASPERRSRLIDAIKEGSIGLDAFYANELTGLCRPEELFEVLACARRLSRELGVPIDSAMITDIPGLSWGVAPALAHSGVKYLSIGPNRGHRIGYALSEWGDKPFYWESPSGEHRVLCWTAGKGYAWFHGTWREADTFDYSDGNVETALDADRVLSYLDELERSGYPYELVQLRYNVGSDNGPPDPGLSDFVRAWNERHVAPRLVITTTGEMCRELETQYGDHIPVVRGDFTPYWEDGAASSARETAMNREAAERLVQAETLWSLLDAGSVPADEFGEAWRQVVLFDEHTWGSWNSISEPDSEFARSQWTTKRAFAEEADRRSRDLLARASGPVGSNRGPVDAVLVFNTCSWPRADVVALPATWTLAGDVVREDGGAVVPSQRLTSGALAFHARDVPPLGAARYTIHAGPAAVGSAVTAEGNRLSNGRVTVVLDGVTGGISSLRHADIPGDLVDGSSGGAGGLNAYFYVAGREPDDPRPNGPVRIEVLEHGPLLASLRVESDAPGCRRLVREVRLVEGQDRVDIVNHVDKLRVLDPEGVHFAFPFLVPGPDVRLDVAWGMVLLGRDQIPGACRNHFSVQRWVDVSNADSGVTLAAIDAPLVEIGAIRADPIAVGWVERLDPSGTLYSYVMNNYWETNYLAAQEGVARFRYSILPHGPFDAAAAHRFGVERSQPLVPVATDATESWPSLLHIEPHDVVLTSIGPSEDGEALMLRLFNASERHHETRVLWHDSEPAATWISNPFEDRLRPAPDPIATPPWGIVTLRCDAG